MLSKIVKANDAKTKLALKAIVAVVFLGTILFVFGFLNPPQSPKQDQQTLKLATQTFKLEVADTDAERVQGLSGRESLGKHTAMLFVFPDISQECMWMKDMRFSLDMVWLDNSKVITKIEQDISPDTYPQTFCGDRTKYVLELSAGAAQNSKLKIGQQLNF